MDVFSDYIVYVDESGDHNLDAPDPTYPVFVLAFCIIRKAEYIEQVVPAIQEMKFRHFGHDMVVFHEHEIRKARGDFAFLTDKGRRETFMADLSSLVEHSSFTVISVCIRKDQLKARYAKPTNPYHLALEFGLERVHRCLAARDEGEKTTHVVFEARGQKEDDELELEFRRVCDGANYHKRRLNLRFVLASKKVNSCGLQLADLVARPIGLNVIRPGQVNRAYDLVEPKLDRSARGVIEGWGLKCFP
ncbi:MAG: DUF3800 domain-containing protein [Phycisphaeraceae bacterium]